MPTIQEVAEKFNVTPEQVKQLRTSMSITWGIVYSDWMECFEGGEEEAYEIYSSESDMVAEATIDADRIRTFCPDVDLMWVYRLEDGSSRADSLALAKATWQARA